MNRSGSEVVEAKASAGVGRFAVLTLSKTIQQFRIRQPAKPFFRATTAQAS
jgi:hypothetical protein